MSSLAGFASFIMILFLMGCKKEHTYECTNSIATYNAGTVDKTTYQAKKHCKSLSSGETTCYLKH